VPVLDTDILSLIQARQEPQYSRIVRRLNALPLGTPVYVTIVTFEEQLRGWLDYVKRARVDQLTRAYAALSALHRDYNTRAVLPFDDTAQQSLARLAASRLRVGTMDLRIAAVVLANNEMLISANLRDFRRIPGLVVEDWSQA
jgi:tRNA(fMet)-specific endonuclease VapC